MVMVTTLGLTVFLDLVTAVVVGLMVAGMVSAVGVPRTNASSGLR